MLKQPVRIEYVIKQNPRDVHKEKQVPTEQLQKEKVCIEEVGSNYFVFLN